MCGIVAGFSKRGQKINKAIMRRYRDQKTRGREGYGYLAMYPNGVSYVRRETEAEIEKDLMDELSHWVMFHHRQPTSTINVEECAHPIFVSHAELDHDYYVVHNGVIGNHAELKTKHEILGYKYTTVLKHHDQTLYKSAVSGREYFTARGSEIEKYNDSEAFAIELVRNIDGMDNKNIDAVGTIAFVCIQVNKKTGIAERMFWGHNERNPLFIENNKEYLWLRSQGGKEVPTHRIYCMDGETLDITYREQHIGREYNPSKSSNFARDYNNTHSRHDVKQLPPHTIDHTKATNLMIKSPYKVNEDGSLMEDVDFDDPSEHDYKRSGKMGFRNEEDPQSTLNWENDRDNGVLGNDDVPYDLILKTPKVKDLVERTLRCQRMRDQYEYAVDRCIELEGNEEIDAQEWMEAREQAEAEIEKLDGRMLDIEAEFYNMSPQAHGGIDYYGMVDDYRNGVSDDELDIMLGISKKVSITENDIAF